MNNKKVIDLEVRSGFGTAELMNLKDLPNGSNEVTVKWVMFVPEANVSFTKKLFQESHTYEGNEIHKISEVRNVSEHVVRDVRARSINNAKHFMEAALIAS